MFLNIHWSSSKCKFLSITFAFHWGPGFPHGESNVLPVPPSQPKGLVRHQTGLDYEWEDRLNMKVTGKMLVPLL